MTNSLASPARIPALDGWRGAVFHALIFSFAVVVVIVRRPDAILNAQFFAEDGAYWFANAYNLGWWHALFLTRAGYLQTLPRLGASIALLVPFGLAPLILNIIAIALQALPVSILLSARSAAWGSLRFRAVLAAFYLILPNTEEISAGITESQWVLALCAFLLLVAERPQSRVARAFDLSIFTLSVLTGPFCILLLPIAAILMRQRRLRMSPLIILVATSLIQGIELLTHPGTRSTAPLGANLEWFVRLLAGQVYLSTLFGASPIAFISAPYLVLFFVCVTVICTVLVWRCCREAPANMRLFVLFAAIIFAVSLVSPFSSPPQGETVWRLLAIVPGRRYWFLPTLAFAWSLLWCVRSQSEAARLTSRVLLFVMCFGLFRDWKRPAFPDMSFATYAKAFDTAPRGTMVVIPYNPAGCEMRLVKR